VNNYLLTPGGGVFVTTRAAAFLDTIVTSISTFGDSTMAADQHDPTDPPPSDTLSRLELAVATLEGELSHHHLLATLLLRDAIEHELREGQVREPQLAHRILAVDERLRALAAASYRYRKQLVRWRRDLRPSHDGWWWWLDRTLSTRLAVAETVILVGALLLFPFGLQTAIDFARLYGSDDTGLQSFLLLLATLLGSLSLGSIMSLRFRDHLTTFIERVGGGVHWRPFAALALILIPLIGIIAIRMAYPAISKRFNERGMDRLAGQEGSPIQQARARGDFERAVRFDPTNAQAHYNLGRVLEDMLEDDQAATEYRIAHRFGLDLAGNNLAHLHLRRNEYDRAAFVLQQSPPMPEPAARAVALRNLGWARWGQKRFAEARGLLEESIRLDPQAAEPHCLLGKTLQALGDPGAQSEWRRCLGLTRLDRGNPAQEMWIAEARSSLDGTAAGGEPQ
jgi:tetratricopeptide (TPR) repeat protein